jgi:hypothetical protein
MVHEFISLDGVIQARATGGLSLHGFFAAIM